MERTRFLFYAIPVPLQAVDGGQAGLRLGVKLTFSAFPSDSALLRDEQVAILTYQFSLLDRDHRELLAYHWQSGAEFAGPDFPHLHVSASLHAQVDALTLRGIDLDKLHIATGPVTLQDVIRMLITEFQIRPLRSDWERRLGEAPTH